MSAHFCELVLGDKTENSNGGATRRHYYFRFYIAMADYQAPSTDNTDTDNTKFKSLGMGNPPMAMLPCLGIF